MPDRIPTTRDAWGIMHSDRRSTHLFAQTYRTRKEAREAMFSWWSDRRVAALALKNKTYRIVKVRIEVIE